MKANFYVLILRAVEEGISTGWAHAHKHTETPSDDLIKDAIEDGIMNALSEVFSFED